MRIVPPIKRLFRCQQLWWRYFQKHQHTLRPAIIDNVIAMLSCGLIVRGYALFECSNSNCSHSKKVAFSCKSRCCPTCGKKATDQWIATQQTILPHTDWQHITVTMPSQLWQMFKLNRSLLGQLSPLAAKPILKTAAQKNALPGIFTALHTFGCDLKWHVHIHLSVTMGGLTADHTQWKTLYFHHAVIMPMWRYNITMLLRQSYQRGELILPMYLQKRCHTAADFNAWLDSHYQKTWHVHFAKSTANPHRNVNYLGRYLKRPPLAQSRLQHYDGQTVIFGYLNHTSGQHESATYRAETFIERFVQHIPDKGLRLIRYYGFLAHRVRSKLLPKVYELVDQPDCEPKTIRWPTLLQKSFGLDPLQCILCQSPLRLVKRVLGLSTVQLRPYHQHLALAKPIAV